MSVERNIEVIHRGIAALNSNTMEKVAPEIVAPGFVRHDLTHATPEIAGPGGVIDFIRMLRQALPDFQVQIVDIFGADDRVVLRLVATGAHQGEFLGVPATGKRIEFNAINIYRLAEGKIVETWQLMDVWGFMSQVGAVSRAAGETRN